MDTFDGPRAGRLDKTGAFLEVSVDAELGLALLHGVGVRVGGPSEGRARTKRLVSPGERGVDDVLAVTADRDESGRSVERAYNVQWCQLTVRWESAASSEGRPRSFPDLSTAPSVAGHPPPPRLSLVSVCTSEDERGPPTIRANIGHVRRKDLGVPGIDDLACCVHGHRRFVPTKLTMSAGFRPRTRASCRLTFTTTAPSSNPTATSLPDFLYATHQALSRP